mmetsp:Transcript_36079/g.84277  ORF Transcript_36079/g.84277 Transcript_36079/m.84277 type:complete len:86 (-) Transcript_36079:478-735(-)
MDVNLFLNAPTRFSSTSILPPSLHLSIPIAHSYTPPDYPHNPPAYPYFSLARPHAPLYPLPVPHPLSPASPLPEALVAVNLHMAL